MARKDKRKEKYKTPLELSNEEFIEQLREKIRKSNIPEKRLGRLAIEYERAAEKCMNDYEKFSNNLRAIVCYLELRATGNALGIAYAGQHEAKDDEFYLAYTNLIFSIFYESGNIGLAEKVAEIAEKDTRKVAKRLEGLAETYYRISKEFGRKIDMVRKEAEGYIENKQDE